MDQYRSRLKLSENFERHWSILISGEIHMDQSLVHTFSWGDSYGPMVLKVLLKFPPTLVLVHGWLFPVGWGMLQFYVRNVFVCASAFQMCGFGRCQTLSGQAIRTPTFCRFARMDSRESIRRKQPIFKALGQIRANRVFYPIRIEIRVIRVQSRCYPFSGRSIRKKKFVF